MRDVWSVNLKVYCSLDNKENKNNFAVVLKSSLPGWIRFAEPESGVQCGKRRKDNVCKMYRGFVYS